MTQDIASFALALRAQANEITARRVSDGALYAVLAGCMKLAERCMDPVQEAELRRLAAALPVLPGKNRHYVEKGTDVYQLVARYIFHGEENSANTSRYACSLRVAASLQIRGDDLAGWLAENGGVNALFMRRPLDRSTIKTKCLRLTSAVEIPKTKSFTVTLLRTQENAFDVLQLQVA